MADMNNNFDFGGGTATAGNTTECVTFDLSGVDENKTGGFEVLPKGVYNAIVDEVEFGESKSSGAPMVTMVFAINGGEYDGRKIYDFYVLGGSNEKAIEFGQAKMKKFLVRVCPEVDLTKFNPAEFANTGAGVGKQLRLDLGIQTQKKGEYKGEKRNTVKDILAPETNSFM